MSNPVSDPLNIRLAGAPTFRDMGGGYVTRDGRVVKRGVLFRAGDSWRLTAADVDKLKPLGLKLIVDLRGTNESAANETRWPFAADTELISANILADMRAGNRSLIELLIQDPTARGASAMLETTYTVLPHALGAPLLKIARHIVDGGKLPLLVHCALGRDRTGMASLLLLHALGVPRDTLIADYLLTNQYIDAAETRRTSQTFMARHNTVLDEEALDVIAYARIENLHAAFRTIKVEYGTLDDYLLAVGIDAELQERMRDRLLETA